MNTKRRFLSIVLVLALIVSPVFPWRQVTVLAGDTQQVFTIDDSKLYTELKRCLAPNILNNQGALVDYDDQAQTVTLDMEKIKLIEIKRVDMTKGNSGDILEALICGCTRLEYLDLRDCNLSRFNFSLLDNKESLINLCLVNANIEEIPDLTLKNLKYICLSQNDLSADGACDNLTKDKLPNLKILYIDDCDISDINFLRYVGELTKLSLGDNRLTDDSITALLEMSGENLSGLQELNLGKRVHLGISGSSIINMNSKNNITNIANLALIPKDFSMLKALELSALKITSLKEFADLRDGISIDFIMNNISDFTGLEGNRQFNLNQQNISLSGDFVEGRESELPKVVKRILDVNDVLSGTLEYNNCSLSEDGTKLVIHPNVITASVHVQSGKLRDSNISFKLKRIPSYTVPQNLTAIVGDTLANILLPEGFSWKDSALNVGAEGTNIFKAVYTPQDTDRYIVVDDIDIPVIVKKAEAEPTPSMPPTPTRVPAPSAEPTPTPEEPSLEPPTPTPEEPTPEPPTPTPEKPTPEPPTPTPEEPTPEPPTPTPEEPTPEPPTPTPEEPTPEPPAPTPEEPTPTPESPTQQPSTPTPIPVEPTPVPTIPIPTLSAQFSVPSAPVLKPTSKPDESNQDGNQIEKRKDLSLLIATGKQKGSNGVRLTWRKWNGCSGYEVYWSYCDGKQNYKKLKEVRSTEERISTHKKLKKDRAYKYYIASYQIKDGRKNYLAKSPIIHVAMNKEKRTNVKNIKLNKKNVVLKIKKTFQIKAVVKKENRKKKLLAHEAKFRYYTNNREIVSLSKRGMIQAKKKGSCTVFVIANNGVSNKVKVIVNS